MEKEAALQEQDLAHPDAVKLIEEKELLVQQHSQLQQRMAEINQREEAAHLREKQTAELEQMLKDTFGTVEKQQQQRDSELLKRHQSLEQQAEKLRQREQRLREAETIRDAGFTQQRKELDEELAKKRCDFEGELVTLRQKRFQELNANIEKERAQRLANLDQELIAERKRCTAELADKREEWEQSLKGIEAQLNERKRELAQEKEQIDSKADDIIYKELRLQSREVKLNERSEQLEEEVAQRTLERLKSFKNEEERLKLECERLRESVRLSEETFGIFEELKRKLGDEDPAKVLLRLNSQEEELKRLRIELIERPTAELRLNYDAMQEENRRLKDLCTQVSEERSAMQLQVQEVRQAEYRLTAAEDENRSLSSRNENLECECKRLQGELKRLNASYEREQDREARIHDIEKPYFTKDLVRLQEPVKEMDWLNAIDLACTDYGLKFPKRILHAFHTALKTAEWSPLTVLAGVSGTGKSELPHLYAHFGGMKFLSLAVQPNWDSQESMLGFFNSIDNKFDAQPVLQLLAQSQRKVSDDYPGLEDVMNLILLDEMNLAYVELYFAEFLSKLELRRGRKGNDVPSLAVKLGAGIAPYELPLGRNVLWAGTMNQDETTKSLSDKVLDRGITIHFPRPTTFERRSKLKPLGTPAPLLERRLWESWWNRDSKFTDEQITPFKVFVEDVNRSLANAGRALGHRVWQSVEYYMANYPEVIAAQQIGDNAALERAMKIAFEDQLVQKVMPKLRGIETRGRAKSECLDKILAQLRNDDYAIVEDFELACEFGYGQFMWHSANYLKEEGGDGQQQTVQDGSLAIDTFLNVGIEQGVAEKLANAGYRSLAEIRDAKPLALKEAGMLAMEIVNVRKKVAQSDGE